MYSGQRSTVAVLLALAAAFCIGLSDAHPNCVVNVPLADGSSTTFPQVPNPGLQFCSMFMNGSTAYQGSCCQVGGPVDEGAFAKNPAMSLIDFNSADPAVQACADVIRELYCTMCHPFAGHIYASEGGSGARPQPWLCPQYCTRVYSACANVPLNLSPAAAVNGDVHFPGLTADMGANTRLVDHFPTVGDYCNDEWVTSNGVACYTDDPSEIVTDPTGPRIDFTAYRAFPNLDLEGVPQRNPEWMHQITRVLPVPGSNPPRLAVAFLSGALVTFVDDPAVNEYIVMLSDSQTETYHLPASEYGAMGVTFHPNFQQNGWIFFKHSVAPLHDKLERFTCNPATYICDPATRITIVDMPLLGETHHGSIPIFMEDGTIIMANGDGTSFSNNGVAYNTALDPESLLGKIIRIDVSASTAETPYTIPTDNPTFDASLNMRGEIWAYGFRNPWQTWWDAQLGHLWVGSVGQNRWESIYVAEPGKFHGWHRREGNNCYYPEVSTAENPFLDCKTPGEVFPVLEYPHDSDYCTDPSDRPHCAFPWLKGSAVIGGFVYRGYNNPSIMNKYIFSNAEPAWMSFAWAVTYNAGNPHEVQTVERMAIRWPEGLQQDKYYPSTMGLTHDGEVILVNMLNANDIMKLLPDEGVPPRAPTPFSAPVTVPPPPTTPVPIPVPVPEDPSNPPVVTNPPVITNPPVVTNPEGTVPPPVAPAPLDPSNPPVITTNPDGSFMPDSTPIDTSNPESAPGDNSEPVGAANTPLLSLALLFFVSIMSLMI